MLAIPLAAVPSQALTVVLGDQVSQISVRQLAVGVAVDLSVNDSPIIRGVLAFNLNRLVRSAYLGFIGDLAFVDMEGNADPDYSGMGTRYQLCYFPPDEL